MIDVKEKRKELLEEHYLDIINNINKHFISKIGFTLKDVLTEENNSWYYVYMTKGIITTLLYFNYIEIFSSYNGNKNFVYRCLKKIENESFN